MATSKRLYFIIPVLFMLSCSSAPKTDLSNSVKNKAGSVAATAETYMKQGDYESALTYYTMALGINLSVDNQAGISANYNSIGMSHLYLKQFDKAEEYLGKALTLAIDIADSNLKVQSLTNLADFYLAKNQQEKAGEYLQQAITAVDKKVSKIAKSVLYHTYANWLKGNNEYVKAVEYVEMAVKLNKSLKLYRELGSNYYLKASIYSKQDNIALAIETLMEALVYDKKGENSPGIGDDLYALGILYERLEENEKAMKVYERAYAVFVHSNLVTGTIKTLENLIALSKKTGQTSLESKYSSDLFALKTGLKGKQ